MTPRKAGLIILIVFSIIVLFIFCDAYCQNWKAAGIGDYGNAGVYEQQVANMIGTWGKTDPNFFIITMGDNNYEYGCGTTIVNNIGQYYSQYIYPYNNAGFSPNVYPKPTILKNRFYPSLGNHDYYCGNILYGYGLFFNDALRGDVSVKASNLTGNVVRYYTFVKGNTQFFVCNTGTGKEFAYGDETDGHDSNSVQGQWLKEQLRLSKLNTAIKFRIVFMHYPPYCSWCNEPSNKLFRMPYKAWGANIVLCGHAHHYERLVIDGFTYVVNGIGGYDLGHPWSGQIWTGSVIRFGGQVGAQLVTNYNDSINFKEILVDGRTIDNFTLTASGSPPPPPPLDTLKNLSDSVKVLWKRSFDY